MGDPYSRLDYRRMIAWPKRIAREWPLLRETLGDPSEKSVTRRILDLGCGTGEHSRFLAEKGYEVVGVDRSTSLLDRAAAEPSMPHLRFVQADLEDLGDAVSGAFDGAICLGNTLPHLRRRAELTRFLVHLRGLLKASRPLVIQLLNYDRIRAHGVRHLPLSFHSDEKGETVFLRLMQAHDDGRVDFFPTSLALDPERDPPLEVVSSQRVELRGWRVGELELVVRRAGFETVRALGSFADEAFDPDESSDLILIAR